MSKQNIVGKNGQKISEKLLKVSQMYWTLGKTQRKSHNLMAFYTTVSDKQLW